MKRTFAFAAAASALAVGLAVPAAASPPCTLEHCIIPGICRRLGVYCGPR